MNFSSPAQDVIQRPVVLDQSQTHGQLTDEEFRDYYELEWTANEIVSNDYKRVRKTTLAWFRSDCDKPHRLPCNSPTSFYATPFQFTITSRELSVLILSSMYSQTRHMAGTILSLYTPPLPNKRQLLCRRSCRTTRRCGCSHSLWSCLYEQVSLSYPPLSSQSDLSTPRNYRLPVIYVFGKKPVDVQHAAKILWESFYSSNSLTKVAVLKHDVAYTHEAGRSLGLLCFMHLIAFAEHLLSALRDASSKHEITILYSPIPRKFGPSNAAATTSTADLSDGDSQDTTPILYIGSPSLALTNLLLTHSATPVRICLRTL